MSGYVFPASKSEMEMLDRFTGALQFFGGCPSQSGVAEVLLVVAAFEVCDAVKLFKEFSTTVSWQILSAKLLRAAAWVPVYFCMIISGILND